MPGEAATCWNNHFRVYLPAILFVGFGLAGLIVLVVSGVALSAWYLLPLPLPFCGLGIWIWLRGHVQFLIYQDRMIIGHTMGRVQTVHFDDIYSVELDEQEVHGGHTTFRVIVNMRQGKDIKVSTGNTKSFYSFLSNRVNRYKDGEDASGSARNRGIS